MFAHEHDGTSRHVTIGRLMTSHMSHDTIYKILEL